MEVISHIEGVRPSLSFTRSGTYINIAFYFDPIYYEDPYHGGYNPYDSSTVWLTRGFDVVTHSVEIASETPLELQESISIGHRVPLYVAFDLSLSDYAPEYARDEFILRQFSYAQQYFGGSDQDVMFGSVGNDTLGGADGNDFIEGDAGNDLLYGGEGRDQLDGGEGDDTLDGGAGDDTLSGGAGNDSYVVDATLDRISELGGSGIDTVLASISFALTSGQALGDVENLTLTGSAALTGTGNALNNVMTGNSGNNRLSGYAGDDSLAGGGGNDTLYGGSGADSMAGDAGNDVLYGGHGNDTLLGGAGNDTLRGEAGNDLMNGGLGNDHYYVESTGDRISELDGGGIDTVFSTVSWLLRGTQVQGAVENLTLTGSAAINASGNDLANVLTGNAGANLLEAFNGNDRLLGNGGDDVLRGGKGNDTLFGGSGNDTLVGGEGNDVLNGDAGRNMLTGGAGQDVFVFAVRPLAGMADTITDFQAGVDRIHLDNAAFGALADGALAARAFAANTSGQATTAAHRVIYETDTGRLWYDANGTAAGGRVQVAQLDAGLSLGHGSFFVI